MKELHQAKEALESLVAAYDMSTYPMKVVINRMDIDPKYNPDKEINKVRTDAWRRAFKALESIRKELES